jgi:outer membrane protein assembly factor BamB
MVIYPSVYAGSMLYALDQNTGSINWVKTGGEIPRAKLDDNHILVGRECLNIKTGESLWKMGASISLYVPELKMGYASGPSTKYHASTYNAFDFSDVSAPPTLVWTSEVLDTRSVSTPTYGDGRLYTCPRYTNKMIALDAGTGKISWETLTPGGVFNHVIFNDGRIYGVTMYGHVICYDAETGKILWINQVQSGEFHDCTPSFAIAYGFYYYMTPSHIWAFDINDGHVVWKYRAGPREESFKNGHRYHRDSPQGWDEQAFSTTLNFYMIRVTAADHKIYTQTMGTNYAYPSLLASGMIGTPSDGRLPPDYVKGQISCLDANTGNVIWRFDRELGVWYVVADGKLYTQEPDYTYPYSTTFDTSERALYKWDPHPDAGYMYCFGKGPTALTVSTDKTTVSSGQQVTISGRLTDLSPAVNRWTSNTQYGRPTEGASNVYITLTYTGADMVRKPIASVKTDMEGKFTTTWTATGSGLLEIAASSPGSDSYHAPEDATTLISVTGTLPIATIGAILIAAVTLVFVVMPIRKLKHTEEDKP